MRRIVLGRTGETISSISLGTWSYGGSNLSGTIPVGWAGQEDQDSRQALVRAWELGINHWDTADVYGDGRSEAIIGSIWDTVPREEVFLASKVGWDKGTYTHYYHPKQMRRQLERSLKNLNTEIIDLYYFHHCLFGNEENLFELALETMLEFRAAGKIRFLGLSDWDSHKVMSYIDRVDPDVVQPYRNVMDDTYESSGLKDWVESNHAGVCFFSPLKHGLLTGKYKKPATFQAGDFRTNIKDFQDPAILARLQDNKQALKDRFKDHPEPVLHGVVDTLLTDAPSGCVLLGQRNIHQVEAAAQVGDPLSEEEAAWVKSLYL